MLSFVFFLFFLFILDWTYSPPSSSSSSSSPSSHFHNLCLHNKAFIQHSFYPTNLLHGVSINGVYNTLLLYQVSTSTPRSLHEKWYSSEAFTWQRVYPAWIDIKLCTSLHYGHSAYTTQRPSFCLSAMWKPLRWLKDILQWDNSYFNSWSQCVIIIIHTYSYWIDLDSRV